jgi:hypothetical protein
MQLMSRTLMTFMVVTVLASVAVLVIGTTSCEKKAASGNASDAGKSAGKTADDAAKAAGEFLAPSKDAAVKAAQETLDDLEKKWKDLQDKAAPATDEAKADLHKAGDQMVQALSDAKAKLVAAKDASDDVWHKDIKPALDAALDKAKKLYDDTAARFSGKSRQGPGE